MRSRVFYICLLLVVCAAGFGLWRAIRARATAGTYPVTYLSSWSPQAAADYLDRRENWWHNWPPAQLDRGTVCVSCHTVVPYAMIRATLGRTLHEVGIPAPENAIMGSVEKRVDLWSEV